MATQFSKVKPVPKGMLDDGFEYSLGPPSSGFSLFLASRTKKVHFIRHAEGFHNVATHETGDNTCLLRGDKPAAEHPLYDSRLTAVGIDQAEKLKDILARRPSGGRSFTNFDLVVVSPLTRTCETARHIFGRARAPGTPAFLDPGQAPVNSPEFAAGIAVPAPRIMVREECRERWGHYVCDGRRSIKDISAEFPDFDFSKVRHDEDAFYTDSRESDDHCCERAVKFLEWLNSRPEKCIAVVTHSSFLRHLFGQFGDSLQSRDKDVLQRMAGNCELRSLVLCSHGIKEGTELTPLEPQQIQPSTIRVSSSHNLLAMGEEASVGLGLPIM